MKNSIRLLALLLVLVMSLSIVACNGTTEESSQAATESSQTEQNTTDLDAVSDKKAPAPSIPDYKGGDTLVVGYDAFSEKFSPFFATTAYDQDAAGMTQVGLLSTDREGNVVLKGIEGEKIPFNGKEYTYIIHGQALFRASLYHFHPAAGSFPEAGLYPEENHDDCPAAVRRY